MDKRAVYLKKAAWIGIIGNAILAGLKLMAGLIAGSYAVVGDGIDSAADVVTFLITLIAARVTSRPADLKYPYGYQKAESVATKALSFVIFFGGIQFIIASGSKILDSSTHEVPGMLAIIATCISIIGKIILTVWQRSLGKRSGSELLIANASNMQNDILISVSVLLSLGVTHHYHLPILDLIMALLIGIWIIRVAYKIFMKANLELMDGIRDPEVYFQIFRAVENVKQAHNPHRLKIREIAGKYLEPMDIEVAPSLSIDQGHAIALEVENAIRKEIPLIHDILIHVEPLGNVEDEVSGITPSEVKQAFPEIKAEQKIKGHKNKPGNT